MNRFVLVNKFIYPYIFFIIFLYNLLCTHKFFPSTWPF
ncbi:hypothetical protein BACUNI_02904 [Bacteroides uniformis ATCC 8492]|uniref:Uncharacterized protein n=1 Tax=Bacteroides uniformis (strain ATCC 8492 / DSM 6597 / CCUG 4942 / CIP 103695 / JCM 5828 / KCTC 5204 / NCTC 13054 / VPI 0061) TaxID=411479 RepID=A0ABC9NA22_BACUC|nr:hypothetical protein BACUNI_02904 [Bacteroides uniformis ATCC 8492]